MHAGGLKRVNDNPRGGSKSKTGSGALKVVGKWLGSSPTRCKHEAGAWQLGMTRDTLLKEFRAKRWSRNLRHALHKLGHPCHKARPVPAKSAPADVRGKFKAKPNAAMAEKLKAGFAILFLDETHVRLEQDHGYAWRRANGKDALKTAFPKRQVATFGVLGTDWCITWAANARNAGEFIEFLEDVVAEHYKIVTALDNTLCHMSKAVRKFVESASGSLELIFPPPYTLQFNPTVGIGGPSGFCWGGALDPQTR